MGAEPEFLDPNTPGTAPEELTSHSFLGEPAESGFPWAYSGGYRSLESTIRKLKRKPARRYRIFVDYSAAAANFGFMLADDTMKSEMRGTISDLKREPLNTP